MSASNWAICPQCLAKAQEEHDKAAAEVYAQYGKVPPEEFDQLRADLKAPDPEDFRTFREDYEFYGADEGEVHARYSGGCTKCTLRTSLKANKRFGPNPLERGARS